MRGRLPTPDQEGIVLEPTWPTPSPSRPSAAKRLLPQRATQVAKRPATVRVFVDGLGTPGREAGCLFLLIGGVNQVTGQP